MASFDSRRATTILTKLEATVTNGTHVVGIVRLTSTHRIRLWHSHKHGELPAFVGQKWRQQLRLSQDEFRDLGACPLSGKKALSLTSQRLGL